MKQLLFGAVFAAATIFVSATPASAALKWTGCNVGQVRAMGNHLAVFCGPPYTQTAGSREKIIPYFAIPYTLPANHFNAVLEILTAAQVHGRKLRIRYDTDVKKNPKSCAASDCRKLVAAVLR